MNPSWLIRTRMMNSHQQLGLRMQGLSSRELNPWFFQPDEHLLKRLAPGTEAAAILIADLQGLQQPLTAFVRLKDATVLWRYPN